MSGPLAAQADLLTLVEIVAWVLGACACNLVRAVEEERGLGNHPWRLLEGFCSLMAVHLWLSLLDNGLGGRTLLDLGMDATRLGAILLLLGAARSGWVSVAASPTPTWVMGMVGVVAAVGVFSKTSSVLNLLETASGCLGGVWMGLVLGRLGDERKLFARGLALTVAGIFGLGLALHVGMERQAWLMVHEDRWRAVIAGLASLLSAMGLAGGLLLYANGVRRRSAVLAGVDLMPMPFMAGALFSVLLMCVGAVATYHVGKVLDANMRSSLLLRVRTAAAAFDVSPLESLRGDPGEARSPLRRKLHASLGRIHAANPDSRFVYLMGKREGKVFFYDDSEPDNSSEHSAFGQAYVEATPELVRAFDMKKGFVEGPVPDRWGIWVSGFAPTLPVGGTGTVVMLGMDVRADHWGREIALRRLLPIGGTIFLLVIIFGSGVGLVRARIYDLQIAHSNQRFRAVFENTFQFQGLLTPEGLLVEANQTALNFIGRGLGEVRGRPFWDTPWWSGDDEGRARLRSAVAEAARGGTVRFETNHPGKDGKVAWVDFSIKPVRDARGRVAMLLPEGRDITERKLVEERLRGTERLLRGVTEASLILLAEREYAKGMPRALEALGKAAEVDRVYIFEDHLHPVDGSPCMSQRFEWAAASATPQIDNPELQNLKYDDLGFRRWLEVFHTRQPIMGLVKDFPEGERKLLDPQDILSLLAMPIYIGDDCWGFIGFDECRRERVWTASEQDILMAMTGTLGAAIQRHRAERAQRESDRKYRDVVEQVKEVIFQTDAGGRWTFLNPAWTEVTRFPVRESLGKMFLDYVHPDDRERNAKAFEPLILRKKDSCRHEVRYLTREGGAKWMEVYARLLIDEQGNTVGTAGTLTDVSERKSAEAQMRLLQRAVDANANGIVISDATQHDNPVVYVNPAFERITGYAASEVIGRNCRFLQGGLQVQPGLTELRAAFKERRATTVVIQNYRKDGTVFWNEFTVAPLLDKEGVLTHYIGLISDVSARVLAEEEMRQLNTQLGEARDAALESVRLKSEFLANMSHEIRTPLHGILGMAQLLTSTRLDPEQQEFLVNVQSCSDALLGIVDEILDFSKIEAGKMSIEEEDLDLRLLLDQALDPFELAARGKGLEFALRIVPETPTYVRGDGLRIRQVLSNLVSNALKFTERGRVVVEVCLAEMRGNLAVLRFEVRDTGIGISADGMKKLFQVFSQVDSSTSRRYGGTGLGLAISRRLTELMGGKMGVESRTDKGSIFWFTLPLERRSRVVDTDASSSDLHGQTVAAKRAEAAAGAFDGGMAARHPLRILVVEDNSLNREVALRLIEKLGYDAELAGDGAEALRAIALRDYDVVLMDIHMPEMDGFEATRKIRESRGKSARPRIMALTANALKGDRERCLEAGMDDYLSKPLGLRDLAVGLERAPSRPAGVAGRSPLISWHQLREVAPDASREIREMVGDLLADTPRALERIAGAAAAKDWKALRNETHKLRGAAATFGFAAFAEELGVMEQAAAALRETEPGAVDRARALFEGGHRQIRLGRAKLLA